jgi:hypothetical protein
MGLRWLAGRIITIYSPWARSCFLECFAPL